MPLATVVKRCNFVHRQPKQPPADSIYTIRVAHYTTHTRQDNYTRNRFVFMLPVTLANVFGWEEGSFIRIEESYGDEDDQYFRLTRVTSQYIGFAMVQQNAQTMAIAVSSSNFAFYRPIDNTKRIEVFKLKIPPETNEILVPKPSWMEYIPRQKQGANEVNGSNKVNTNPEIRPTNRS